MKKFILLLSLYINNAVLHAKSNTHPWAEPQLASLDTNEVPCGSGDFQLVTNNCANCTPSFCVRSKSGYAFKVRCAGDCGEKGKQKCECRYINVNDDTADKTWFPARAIKDALVEYCGKEDDVDNIYSSITLPLMQHLSIAGNELGFIVSQKDIANTLNSVAQIYSLDDLFVKKVLYYILMTKKAIALVNAKIASDQDKTFLFFAPRGFEFYQTLKSSVCGCYPWDNNAKIPIYSNYFLYCRNEKCLLLTDKEKLPVSGLTDKTNVMKVSLEEFWGKDWKLPTA